MKNDITNIDQVEFLDAKVNEQEISSFDDEDPFNSIGVELMKEGSIITSVVGNIYPVGNNGLPRLWNRNEAVLSGMMIRVTKLQSGFLDQFCKNRGELVYLLCRPLSETLINLNYLLLNISNLSLFDDFIEYSLREEKRMLLTIENNIKERKGQALPIESRMISSINKAFEKSGIKPDQVNEKNTKSWGTSIYFRAKKIGKSEFYLGLMGLPSHAVHGNWQDLLDYHLDYKDGLFEPHPEWKPCRPQIIINVSLFSAIVTKLYLETLISDNQDRKLLIEKLDKLSTKLALVDKYHEKLMQKWQNQ